MYRIWSDFGWTTFHDIIASTHTYSEWHFFPTIFSNQCPCMLSWRSTIILLIVISVMQFKIWSPCLIQPDHLLHQWNLQSMYYIISASENWMFYIHSFCFIIYNYNITTLGDGGQLIQSNAVQKRSCTTFKISLMYCILSAPILGILIHTMQNEGTKVKPSAGVMFMDINFLFVRNGTPYNSFCNLYIRLTLSVWYIS